MWPLWALWNSSAIWRNWLELVIMMLGLMMMVIVMLKRMNFLTMRCTWPGSSVHSLLQAKRRVLRLPSGWHNSCQSYRTHVYLGSDLWVRMPVSVKPFWDLTDVTLADENTSSIQADNANLGEDYALLTKTKYQNKWLIIYEHLVLVVDHLEDDLPHQVDEGEHSAAHQGRGQNWPLGNAFHTILTMRWDLVKNKKWQRQKGSDRLWHRFDWNLPAMVSNLRMKAIMRIVFTVKRQGTRIMTALKSWNLFYNLCPLPYDVCL